MKYWAMIAVALMLPIQAAKADAELARKKTCLACHAVDKKLVGPAYRDVAAKYAKDADAVNRLATKIQKGGVGVWGQIPMPANPLVNEAEARQLAAWVLKQK